jgi:hypothetical protein
LSARDPHWTREQIIFDRFVRAAGISIRLGSIRRGEGFDVACEAPDGSPMRFELTEVVDQGAAASLGAMMQTGALLSSRLQSGTDSDSAAIRQRYKGRDIGVTLAPRVGSRQLRPLVGPLFAWLASHSPDGIGGVPLPPQFGGVIAKVGTRNIETLPALIHCLLGQALWISDSTVGAIAAKLAKGYQPGLGLQLLTYFYLLPSRPDSAANARAYLDVEMRDDVFSQVWLFDGHTDQVLLKYPQ